MQNNNFVKQHVQNTSESNSNGQQDSEKITFSFGENWSNFSSTVDEKTVQYAIKDISEFFSVIKGFDKDFFKDKTVLDIGSGSGIHSLAFHLLGAKEVYSFDYDKKSVEATKKMWEKSGSPSNWRIEVGSVLDLNYMNALPKFDIVYSWGVLHHTGEMWNALDASLIPLKNHGYYFIALYVKTNKYPKQLALKKRYNKASKSVKKLFELKLCLREIAKATILYKNPFKWNEKKARGMTPYYDIIDWLGGLPYEVASPEEVVDFSLNNNLRLLKLKTGKVMNVYFLGKV